MSDKRSLLECVVCFFNLRLHLDYFGLTFSDLAVPLFELAFIMILHQSHSLRETVSNTLEN